MKKEMTRVTPIKDTTITGIISFRTGAAAGTAQKISKGRYRSCRPWG